MSPMRRFVAQWSDVWRGFRVPSPPRTVVFRVPFYERTPLVSPHLVRSEADVPRLERTLRKYGSGLYVNRLLPLDASRRGIDARLRELGYTCVYDCRVIEFRKPRELRLPSGYRAAVGPFSDKALFLSYAAVTARCFDRGGWYARTNSRLTKKLESPSWLAVIYGPRNVPVAVSGVTVGRKTALLFGGCVIPGHRRRGLWKALLALRQGVARGRGVEACLLLSANPRLFGAAERARRLLTYRKRAEPAVSESGGSSGRTGRRPRRRRAAPSATRRSR